MRTHRSLTLLMAGLVAIAALGAARALPAAGENPYEFLIKIREADQFNERLTQTDRDAPAPRRGGTVVRRMPTDFEDLNPITSTGADAQYAMEYFATDKLLKMHPEYYERVPWIADWWTIQDIVYLKDGTRIVGLITDMDGELFDPASVTIQPGAMTFSVGKTDIVEMDAEAGTLTLKDGTSYEGDMTVFHFTVAIDTKGEGEPRVIANDELAEVEYIVGNDEKKTRKAVNKQCLFRFHFREDPMPTWHDGEPIKPEDAVLSVNTILNPFVDSMSLRAYLVDMKSTRADGRVWEVEWGVPYMRTLRVLAEIYLLPSHLIAYDSYAGDGQAYGDYFNKFAMYKPGDQPVVGNGPYRRVRWIPSTEMVLERYEDYWASKAGLPYWNAQQPYLDSIVYKIITDPAAARVELIKGAVDCDFDVEPSTWLSDETNTADFKSRVVRAKVLTPSYTYIGWQQKNPIFQDKRVRQALAMLIPRERILREVHGGLGKVQPSCLFIEGPAHDPELEPRPYDPDAAVKLLRQAGWLDRDNDGVLDNPRMPESHRQFRFTYRIHTARQYHAKIADIVKEELGKAKIHVDISKDEWTVFVDKVKDQDFDAMRFAWGTDFMDPDEYQIYHSSQAKNKGSNSVNFANAEADRLMEQVRVTFDYAERIRLNRELERLLWEEAPYTYMFSFDELFFYSPKFRNVKFWTIRPGYDFSEWYVDPEWKQRN
jgi:peptide/nickel transport system substrate-binding protein